MANNTIKVRSAADRFNEKWEPVTESGCWIWMAGRFGPGGYGCIQIGTWKNQKKIGAHRLSYILHKGQIPDGLMVLHKCDIKECVNPDHLYLGNHTDNINDAYARNRRPRKYAWAPRPNRKKKNATK